MKKVYLFVAALFVFAASCDKVAELTYIEKDLDFTGTVDVPGLPGGADTVLPGTSITGDMPGIAFATNSKQFLEENGSSASADYVHHVKLKKFGALTIVPENGNFDYLDSLYVYLSADGLGEKLVASKAIPKGQSSVELNCVDVDLKDYFLKDSMYVRMGGRFVGVPESGKIQIKPTFNVKANPLKKDK